MNRTIAESIELHGHRGGFALPAAILGIVVVGVLVTGGFFVAQQESRISIATRNSTRALYNAEMGLNQVITNWNGSAMANMAAWDTVTTEVDVDGGRTDVLVTALGNNTYFLDGQSRITEGGEILGGGSRRIGLLAKVFTAQINPPAALTTQGDVSLRGGAQVLGGDNVPDGWDNVCPTDLDDKPGVMTDPDSEVTTQGSSSVDGDPPTATDPSISDQTFTEFGEFTWDDLVSLADKAPSGPYNGMAPSYTANGDCNTADPYNWGEPDDPTDPCGDYFPIIYLPTGGTMQGNSRGQGILLVDGDLELRGSFVFHGIIITQGAFETQGSGHRIMGGVMARNATLDQQALVGSSIVQNSTCAATRAILNNNALNQVRPVSNRSWVDLTGVAE